MADINFETKESRYTGGLIADFFVRLLSDFVIILSLGILWPFMFCWYKKWQTKHTYINGKQLVFDGNGFQFWGRYMLWWFLSIITLGIYYIFFMSVGIAKWETKHTHFAENVKSGEVKDEENKSYFDGNAIQLIGVKLLKFLIMIETLCLGYYWVLCIHQRWYGHHQVIDGERLYFDGNGLQLLGKVILWMFLTIITLGIFGLWMRIFVKKWVIHHTHVSPDKSEKVETPHDAVRFFIGSMLCLVGSILFMILSVASTLGSISMGVGAIIATLGGIVCTIGGIVEIYRERKTKPTSSLFAVATLAIGALLIEITIILLSCGINVIQFILPF